MIKHTDFFSTMVDDLDTRMSIVGDIEDFDSPMAILLDLYGEIFHSRELLANKYKALGQVFNAIQSELESMSNCITTSVEMQEFDSHADNLMKIIKDFLEVVE